MPSLILLPYAVPLILGIVFLVSGYRAKHSLPLPPGPRPLFLLGNLFDIPTHHRWVTFTKWGREYGRLTHLAAAGQHIIVINDQDVAVELFDKRSANYSQRPSIPMCELSGLAWISALLSPRPTLRDHKKLFHHVTNSRSVQRDMAPIQQRFARKLAWTLLSDANGLAAHISRSMGEMIQTITYGDFFDGDVDLVALGRLNSDNGARATSGHLVDIVPWIKHLPECEGSCRGWHV